MKISIPFVAGLAFSCLLHAQDLPSAPQPAPDAHDNMMGKLFHVTPTAQMGENLPPLTSKQKFKIATINTFAPFSFLYSGAVAGVGYAADWYPGYGRGGAAFGKYYGAAFGDQGIGQYMTQAVFPSAFKQDPRYYRMGKGKFSKRVGYAISREWVTRSDAGNRQYNFSALAGNLATAGISNLYYPDNERTVGATFGRWGIRLAGDAGFNLYKEFWPDTLKLVGKRK